MMVLHPATGGSVSERNSYSEQCRVNLSISFDISANRNGLQDVTSSLLVAICHTSHIGGRDVANEMLDLLINFMDSIKTAVMSDEKRMLGMLYHR